MKAAILKNPLEIEIEEIPIPKPGNNEVLIKVMAVGICGSDLHYYEYGRIGRRVVEEPLIQGHECAGIIVEVGVNVSRFNIGDKVSIEPGISCGRCGYCRSGRYNLCSQIKFLSTPPVNGALAQYITHPEDFVFKLPNNLTFERASLVEPLSVGIHTARRTRMEPGSTILVSGMGPVGLTMVMVAKAYGVKNIIVSDIEPFRLQTAKELGAWKTINVLEENVEKFINRVTDHEGVDMAIDTSGNHEALRSAIEVVKRGGKLAVIGFPSDETVPVNLTLMLQKEIDLISIYRYTNTFHQGLEILASESSAGLLITDRYPLIKAHEAFEKLRRNKQETLKVIIKPNN